jgi:hypothetical protein
MYKWKFPSRDQLIQRKKGAAIRYPRIVSILAHEYKNAKAILKTLLPIGATPTLLQKLLLGKSPTVSKPDSRIKR